METPPATASIVWNADYEWTDKAWIQSRATGNKFNRPLSVYELHIGSWRRNGEGNLLTYRELAAQLPGYCSYMGFTHVELMPVMEHPFYGSWGYQVTGYFAPSSRFGTPEDLKYLINELHLQGIGVLLDWVPAHFPGDEHGLVYFDGTHLYEHADPRKGYHPDWSSYIFNYGRNEVRAFLISNAIYWLQEFHADGLRVDAVASMLYLDYSRNPGEWVPNELGGREHLEVVHFLQQFNTAVHLSFPDVLTIAEESSSWPGVTANVSEGGLGFDLKWMMGWMHDTLNYFSLDPIFRSFHQNKLTFNVFYAFTERFMLPLSHDEVVYGKGALYSKMPGDDWQKAAHMRLLYGYMYAFPGAKLLFMGGEFGQQHEWRHDYSLDWHENDEPGHNGIQLCLKALNELYTQNTPMHELDYNWAGFEWIDFNDNTNSVVSWLRRDEKGNELIFIFNFTPVVRTNYRIGMPRQGYYDELFNTDACRFGGSGIHNIALLETAPIARHGRQWSLSLVLPPLAVIVLQWKGGSV
jgi:1,4-alpha-glucan branching enzyme